MKKILTILFLLTATIASAAEITFDQQLIQAEDRILIKAAVLSLIQEANNDVYVPTTFQDGKITADFPGLASVVDEQKVQVKIDAIQAANTQAQATEETAYQNARDAVKTKLGMTENQFNNFIKVLRKEMRE